MTDCRCITRSPVSPGGSEHNSDGKYPDVDHAKHRSDGAIRSQQTRSVRRIPVTQTWKRQYEPRAVHRHHRERRRQAHREPVPHGPAPRCSKSGCGNCTDCHNDFEGYNRPDKGTERATDHCHLENDYKDRHNERRSIAVADER